MQERDVSSSGSGRVDLNLDVMLMCSLSLHAYVPERSSPSRVRFAAQNRRALDGSGPFRRFPIRREREPMQTALGRWSVSSRRGQSLQYARIIGEQCFHARSAGG